MIFDSKVKDKILKKHVYKLAMVTYLIKCSLFKTLIVYDLQVIEKVLDWRWYDLRDKCQLLNMSYYKLLLM